MSHFTVLRKELETTKQDLNAKSQIDSEELLQRLEAEKANIHVEYEQERIAYQKLLKAYNRLEVQYENLQVWISSLNQILLSAAEGQELLELLFLDFLFRKFSQPLSLSLNIFIIFLYFSLFLLLSLYFYSNCICFILQPFKILNGLGSSTKIFLSEQNSRHVWLSQHISDLTLLFNTL